MSACDTDKWYIEFFLLALPFQSFEIQPKRK